jgi:uncharacterized protein YegL
MNEQIDQIVATGFGHGDGDIHGNADRRCPTVLLLDVSGSMSGKPLEELQAGLTQYIDEVAADSLARRRLEIAIVTFGGTVQVVQEFATPDRVLIPTLSASGDTPMGQAIVTGLDLLKNRRIELSRQAIPQYKPWVFLITDGGPTDDGREIWHEGVPDSERAETIEHNSLPLLWRERIWKSLTSYVMRPGQRMKMHGHR